MKIDKKLLAITCLVTILPIVVGVMFWDRLPDRMVTHWGIKNEPNGWSSKPFAVFGIPLLLMALQMICVLGGRYGKWGGSEKLQKLVLWIIPAASLLVMATVYGYAMGAALSIDRFVLTFIGVMFAIIGNYLPKCRQNRTVGIKLPWTLRSEENWNRTHRFAGPIWVACGLVLLMIGLFGLGHTAMAIAVILVMTLLPMVYSYRLYKKEKSEE